MNTFPRISPAPDGGEGNDLEYSIRVAEIRRLAGLTQSQFARAIGVKRGAVAQWEGGVREPRDRVYLALAEFAGQHGEPSIERFFRSRIDIRRAESNASIRRRIAREYYASIVARGSAHGDAFLKRVNNLSLMGHEGLAEHQATLVIEAKRSLKGRAFATRFYQITLETEAARVMLAQRRLTAPRRHGSGGLKQRP